MLDLYKVMLCLTPPPQTAASLARPSYGVNSHQKFTIFGLRLISIFGIWCPLTPVITKSTSTRPQHPPPHKTPFLGYIHHLRPQTDVYCFPSHPHAKWLLLKLKQRKPKFKILLFPPKMWLVKQLLSCN